MKTRLLLLIGVVALSACAETHVEETPFAPASQELSEATQAVAATEWYTLDAWQIKLDAVTGAVLNSGQFSISDAKDIWPETVAWPHGASRGSLSISGIETDAASCNTAHGLSIPTASNPWLTEGVLCMSVDYTHPAGVDFDDVYVEVSHLSDDGYQAYRWPLGTATNTNDDDHLKASGAPVEVYQDVAPTPLSTYGITADAWGVAVNLAVIPIDVWEIPIDVWEIPIDVWEIPIDVWEIPIDVWESPATEQSLWEMDFDDKSATNSSVLTLRNAQAAPVMTVRVLGRLPAI